jgi:hypothetical protein
LGKLVWLASYPKSGNTWLRAFLHNYITDAQAPYSLNALTDFSAVECAAAWFGGATDRTAVQRLRPAVHQRLTRLHADLVFVKTHNANLAVDGIALCTPTVTAGAIVVVRDPRDVAVSFARYLGKPLDEVIGFMAHPRAANAATDRQVFEYLSSWSAHVASWLGSPGVLVVRYEDMLADAPGTFGKIIAYLGSEVRGSGGVLGSGAVLGAGAVPPERLARAITFSAFGELAAQEQTGGYLKDAGGAAFFAKGTEGQWREALSAAQARQIENAHGPVMARCGY